MDFEVWEPIYLEILKEFGFDRKKDEDAARLLDSLAEGKRVCLERCLKKVIGKEVTVCGNGSDLERELDLGAPEGTLIAADAATDVLLAKGLVPDIIVTDLDGDWRAQQQANSLGAIVVIHAHGDNMPTLRSSFAGFKGRVALTTQSVQVGKVRNYGGFTDGDRAVELARSFGTKRITLLGFDFSSPRYVAYKNMDRKRGKLEWARRIIYEHNPIDIELIPPQA